MSQVSAIEKMGSSNVGESIDIVQNCDYAFIVNRVISRIYDGETLTGLDKYLVFKLIACRDKEPEIMSFQHRFKDGNDMALVEDEGCKVSQSIYSRNEMVNEQVSSNGQRTKGPRKLV